jgi:hypothetical protein
MHPMSCYTLTLHTRRAFCRLGLLAAAAALTGCSDPAGPAAPASAVSPSPIIIIGGHPIVFNAQLLAIGNPDEKPPTAVEGHLQLKIYETEAGFQLAWNAAIVNPECEVAPTLGGGIYAIQDSEDLPNPEDPALVDLRPAEPLGCGTGLLEGVTGISAELAARLFSDPEEFIVVFFIVDGVKLAGTLQLGGPDTAPTR